MTNLLKKLNVLVRASVNSVLSDASGQETPRAGQIPAERLGKNIDQEVAALRKRIEEALTEEETLQTRLDDFQQQIDSLDRQADAAVAQGDEIEARRLIQQMQRQQQSATMLQANLEEHRQSTSDLIQQVNTLEALVSDSRRAAPSDPIEPGEPSEQPVVDTSAERTPGVVLSNLLREARERVEQAITPPSTTPGTPGQPAADEPVQHIPVRIQIDTANTANTANTVEKPGKKDADVDDDLAKRRARLSKPE